jgi:hypothetical protein
VLKTVEGVDKGARHRLQLLILDGSGGQNMGSASGELLVLGGGGGLQGGSSKLDELDEGGLVGAVGPEQRPEIGVQRPSRGLHDPRKLRRPVPGTIIGAGLLLAAFGGGSGRGGHGGGLRDGLAPRHTRHPLQEKKIGLEGRTVVSQGLTVLRISRGGHEAVNPGVEAGQGGAKGVHQLATAGALQRPKAADHRAQAIEDVLIDDAQGIVVAQLEGDAWETAREG